MTGREISFLSASKDQFIITTTAAKPIRAAIRAHVVALGEDDREATWSFAKTTRARYAVRLDTSLRKWSEELPFMRTLGNLPGGRDQEKKWSEKNIEVKDRFGVARTATLLTQEFDTADAVLVVDLSPLFLGKNEMPLEMEEG